MKIIFFLKTIYRISYYVFFGYKRYAHLLINVLFSCPKSILEIGVYQGRRSKEMIEAAKVFSETVYFYGFDLFELMNEELLKKEISKFPLTENHIFNKLKKTAYVKLYKGFSDKTLPKFVDKQIPIDFVFIDGGHSRDTIYSDWKNVEKIIKNNSVVMFDDYYIGKKNDSYGCKFIFDNIDEKKYSWKLCSLKDDVLIENLNFKNSLVKLKKIN